MDKIFVNKVDESKIRVFSTEKVEREIKKHFTFDVPGARFMPAFRRGTWDGKIRLFDSRNELYYGLIENLYTFAKEHKYSIEFDQPEKFTPYKKITEQEALKFVKSLKLPEWVEIRDYQISAFMDAVNSGRKVLVSPTGSGKSLIMYLVYRWHNMKSLLIVPKKNLVNQMYDEVKQYNYHNNPHKIYSGKEKDTDEQLVITTWQSIYKMPKKWFKQFKVVIVDEVHRAKSESITNILLKCSDIKYRFGFTGSLDGKLSHKWIIEGLLGPIKTVTTTRKLIDNKTLPDLNIKCIVLSYPQLYLRKKWDYQSEIDAICDNELRNDFIVDLVNRSPGVNMVLFHFISKHGDLLAKKFQDKTNRKFIYVHGKSEKKLKENLKSIMEQYDDCIVLASDSMFAEGFNVKHINNIFFAHPSKDRIKIIQSIGRSLRKTKNKVKATVFDISDQLYEGKRKNYTLQHFFERLKIYKEEEHPFKIFNKKLGKKR